MKVFIPTPLLSYTKVGEVQAQGQTLVAVMDDLETHYPGLRFRVIDEQGNMRPHMRFFVNGEQVFDLARPVNEGDEVHLVQALSGG